MMGFPAESAVTGPADAERFLDWRVDNDADLIKIIVEDPAATEVPALSIETLTALVKGADARGLLSVAHVVTAAAFDRRLGDHADAAFAVALGNVRAMLDTVITVIAGTDANETPFAPVLHGPSLHEELNYLITAGMTRAEAIRSATSSAAEALRLGDRGRTVEGARADLVLIDRNPIADISVLRTPRRGVVGRSKPAPT